MPEASPARRSVASSIAAIQKVHGPDDPRLTPLRERLDAIGVAEIHDWAHRAAAALPPLSHEEIDAVGRQAARIDARLACKAGGNRAAS